MAPAVPDIGVLKATLRELSKEQSDALAIAIYGGMTRKELTDYDERALKVRELISQLNALEGH